jgi:hypothetical protein
MAQTVSTVKFSTSVTFNQSTHTIFTAPSGTACRVILNALNCYIDAGTTATPSCFFMINNGTTGAMVMAYVTNPNSSSGAVSQIGILPGNMSGPTGVGVGTNGVVAGGICVTASTSAASNLSTINPSSAEFGVTSTGVRGTYFPAQFWMCAGDTFQMKFIWGNHTGVIQGSMTIITES